MNRRTPRTLIATALVLLLAALVGQGCRADHSPNIDNDGRVFAPLGAPQ